MVGIKMVNPSFLTPKELIKRQATMMGLIQQ